MKEHVFNMKDPIIVGMEVIEGTLRVGTPLCIPALGGMEIGRVTSIEQVSAPCPPNRHACVGCVRPYAATSLLSSVTRLQFCSFLDSRIYFKRQAFILW